jgi:hypothetical protein
MQVKPGTQALTPASTVHVVGHEVETPSQA